MLSKELLVPFQREDGCGRPFAIYAANITTSDANILPAASPDVRAEMMFASEVGTIKVSDRLSTSFEWYRAAARIREIKSGQATKGAAVPEYLHPLDSRVVALGGEAPPVFLLPGIVDDGVGPGVATKDPAGDACAGSWDEDTSTIFSYGEVSFCIPTRWLNRYISRDRASSTDDTLDFLWREFRSRRDSSDSTIAGLLHCWNIGTTHRFDVPWSAFWADGGPLNFYINALALIDAFPSYIRDESTDTTICEGLDSFCDSLIEGGRVRNKGGDGPCDLRIFVRSLDARFNAFRAQNCIDEMAGEPAATCGSGFNSACGPEYDLWLNLPPFPGSAYWHWTVLTPFGHSRDYTSTDCTLFMAGGGFGIRVHASLLAYQGFIADFLMWWARCAMDYANEKGSLPHLKAASELARFVLFRISTWSKTFIHELGHCYLGGGHCDPHRCCFDIAAERWHCKVIAKLGLPRANTIYPVFSSDTASGNEPRADSCGIDNDVATPICYTCRIDDYAVPESDSSFRAGTCGFTCPDSESSSFEIDPCLRIFGCDEEVLEIPDDELPGLGGGGL